jgi:hypothetical protein
MNIVEPEGNLQLAFLGGSKVSRTSHRNINLLAAVKEKKEKTTT